MRRRVGRPPGPSTNCRPRPWDPVQLTFREYAILSFVAANPDMPRWLIAERFGISQSPLSIVTCSALGRWYLDFLSKVHRPEGASVE